MGPEPRPLIAAFLVISVSSFGYAYFGRSEPFPPRFVQTCDTAIADRLIDPSTYERNNLQGSRRTLSYDEFFADPMRAVAVENRKSLIGNNQPVQYQALIDYRAQDAVGAIIQERAHCTFNSLDGKDAPTKTLSIMIDGETNLDWVKRQPDRATRFQRILKNL